MLYFASFSILSCDELITILNNLNSQLRKVCQLGDIFKFIIYSKISKELRTYFRSFGDKSFNNLDETIGPQIRFSIPSLSRITICLLFFFINFSFSKMFRKVVTF